MSTTAAKSIARPKRNFASSAKQEPEVPQHIRDLARFFYTENKRANQHSGSAKKFRTRLYQAMKLEKLVSIAFPATVGGEVLEVKGKAGEFTMKGGNEQRLTAAVGRKKSRVVSIELLAQKVDMATLLKIVEASHKACEEHVPKSVLEQCLVEVEGDENVTVTAE